MPPHNAPNAQQFSIRLECKKVKAVVDDKHDSIKTTLHKREQQSNQMSYLAMMNSKAKKQGN